MNCRQARRHYGANQQCFSRSGWWQTLCGLDAANQGFGWTSIARHVGCKECLKLVAKKQHLLRVRPLRQYLAKRASA